MIENKEIEDISHKKMSELLDELRLEVSTLQKENKNLIKENTLLKTQIKYSNIVFSDTGKVINDPIQGYISIDEKIIALIDTKEFQRLRWISQLGYAHEVYPNAFHNRLAHSFGALELGRNFLKKLIQSFPDLEIADQNVFLAACLLHDIGHPAFSHVLEDLPNIPNHDILSAKIILNGEIKKILEEEWEIDPRRVAVVIGKKISDPSYLEEEEELSSILRKASEIDIFFSNILHCQIGPDKLDYLHRDAYFSGAKHGFYDAKRLIDCLTFKSKENEYEMIVTEKGIPLVEQALFSYYEMFRTLYWHHCHRSVTAMAKRAVEDAINDNTIEIKDILTLTDIELLLKLRSCETKSTKDLANRIWYRQLYKRGITLGMHDSKIESQETLYRIDLFRDLEKRRNSEKKIVDFINNNEKIRDYEILIDIPNLPKWKFNIDFKAENPVKEEEPIKFTQENISALTIALEKNFSYSVWKLRIFCSKRELKKSIEEYWKLSDSL